MRWSQGGATSEKPTGPYAAEMIADGAWPDLPESTFEQRANMLSEKLSGLTTSLDGWDRHKASLFNGPNIWIGSGSEAASTSANEHSASMRIWQGVLRAGIDWCNDAAEHIRETKRTIRDNVAAGQREISDALDDARESGDDPSELIDGVVSRKQLENKNTVKVRALSLGGAADLPETPVESPNGPAGGKDTADTDQPENNIQGFTGLHGRPGADALRGGLQGTPAATVPKPPLQENRPDALEGGLQGTPSAGVPTAPTQQPSRPGAEGLKGGVSETPSGGGAGNVPNQPGSSGPKIPMRPTDSVSPVESVPSAPVGAPVTSGGFGTGGGGGTSGGAGAPSAPSGLGSSPTDGAGKPDNGFGKMDPTKMAGPTQPPGGPSTGMQPPANPLNQMAHGLANAGPAMQPSAAPISPPTPTPDVGAGAPGATGAPGASSGGASGGTWSGGSAPVSSTPSGGGSSMGGGMPPAMPLGPPPTPSPSAPSAPSGGSSGGSGSASSQPGSASVHPASTNSSTNSAAAAAAAAAGVAPMPVSAARLERDAVIAATSGGSSRGKSNDALTVARRIAAALNAIQVVDFGFFWMTAVAADDTIVVANSYGIGYIPEGVNLPAQVKFANIDEAIPPADRGKWTSYPLLMLQGWAQHHNNPLKQVIATEEQFKGSDPGVAKIVLQPDDIPTNGTMQGRSRLEVVAPHAAERLSSTSDFNLTELLPPAPADPQPQAEEDQFMKWFSVMQCLMSDMEGRVQAHLKAFVSYADYAQEQALYAAHAATDATAQRAAIADWVYWQHLSVLMSDALQAGVTV